MSVVVPSFGHPGRVEVLLEALAQQTYPPALTEVIVVDDGSDPPLSVVLPDQPRCTLIRQERSGFGLARARNTGARAARGDVVVFLDADMVPERVWLESHARPHHHQDHLAAVGPRTHVARLEVGRDEILSGRPIEQILGDYHPSQPAWLLERWSATDDGRLGDDVWWGMSGGNFSVTRKLFLEVGGYDEDGFREWGGEDNDLGFRLYERGAFVVPVHAAMAWHLGPATNDSPEINELRRRVRIRLGSRVASHLLPRYTGVSLRTPDVTVSIENPLESFETAMDLVSQILDDSTDLLIGINIPPGITSEVDLMTDYLAAEHRVAIGPPTLAMSFAPISVLWSGATHWPLGLGGWLRSAVGESRAAVVHIGDRSGKATAWSTRVLQQVRAGILTESEASARFGGRTCSWEEVHDELSRTSTLRLQELQGRASEAEARLAQVANRRILRFADSLGSLARARTGPAARAAWRSLIGAFRSQPDR